MTKVVAEKMNIEISNYELNKMLMAKEPPMEDNEEVRNLCKNYFIEKYLSNTRYFMLLNNELKDYTVFVIKKDFCPELMVKDLFEVCKSRGTLKSIEKTESDMALEIWINNSVYYLFPYDEGVIEY